MLGGYVGRLLRVDLTSGAVREMPLPKQEVLRRYVGGLGLAVKILCEETPKGIGPLDPESRLIFMTGPLTGTPVPSGNNCAIVSFNADTGFTVGAGHTHGQFGPQLKFAGYDGIVVQGASSRPVYLWVHDGRVEIRDAGKIWGKDTHETEDLVKAEVGDPQASVAAIGPAGENLIGGACVTNDKYHVAAFGGTGAVMGSKKLKAIAAHGAGGVPLAQPKMLVEVAAEWRPKMAAHRPYLRPTRGVVSPPATMNLLSSDLGREIYTNMAQAEDTYRLTPKPCFSCPKACAYKVEVTQGPLAGFVGTLGGGGESMEGAALMVAVKEPARIWQLTDLYDRLGVNSCTVGTAIALAFECFERGLLTVEDTDGLELHWGDADAAAELLRRVVARQGFGQVLAEGPKKAAQRIGGDAPTYAVHIKGVSFRLHDYREQWGALFAQAAAGAGPRGEATMGGAKDIDPDLGLTAPLTAFDPKPLPAVYRRKQMKHLFDDSIGVCMFALGAIPGIMQIESRALAAAIGWPEMTVEEQLTVGERIANMERVFNLAHGLTVADDQDLSPRVLEPPRDGPAKGKTFAPYLKDALVEYYRLMGWDETTGKPLPQTLARLGLEHLGPLLP